MASKFQNPLHLLNSLRKAPVQTFQDATMPEAIALGLGGGTAIGLGAYGLGNLLGYDSNLSPVANPAPVSNNGQQMAPAPARPVAQQNAGTGISNPQVGNPNLVAVMRNVAPLDEDDLSRLMDYTGRNLNRDAILYEQLVQLQQQLEGVA